MDDSQELSARLERIRALRRTPAAPDLLLAELRAVVREAECARRPEARGASAAVVARDPKGEALADR